jgi:hypothetical protein
MRGARGPAVRPRRSRLRPLAGAAGAGLFALLLGPGCEPQDIYLFDGPPTNTRIDAGGVPDAPPDPDEPAPPDDQEPSPPACETPACDTCVEGRACAVGSTLLFCHPRSGECALPCDASAGAEAPGNCPLGRQCDAAGICVECRANSDCGAELPACDLARNRCVECVVGGDSCPAARPVCDPIALRCIECAGDADCAATGQVCVEAAQRCVQCETDLDCRGRDDDVVCLPGELRCVECVSDADCRLSEPDKPFCSSERECEDERK